MAALTFREWQGREGDRSHLTRREDGTIFLRDAIVLKGARGERRQWHVRDGEKWFGNYTEARWNAFLDDIRKNGIREPVFIIVDPGKEPLVHEGNHRIQAAKQLGLREIPVEIKYFGHSEKDGLVAPDTRRTKVATKSRAEKEDEQANNLIRPDPKKKPPRMDLRKHRVDPDEDPDLKDDDVDMSMNYKDIGASLRVAQLWMAVVRLAQDSIVRKQDKKKTWHTWDDQAGPKEEEVGQDEGEISKEVKEQALKEYKAQKESHPESKMTLKDFVERVQDRRKIQKKKPSEDETPEEKALREEAQAEEKAKAQEKARLQKAENTVEIAALEVFEETDLPRAFREQMKEALADLTPEETVKVVEQFENTLRELANDPPTSEEAIEIAKQMKEVGTSPDNAGEQMAHALYTARVTLNPLRLGGKPISGEPKSAEALKERSTEALRHFERLTSEDREDAVQTLIRQRDELEPGSPEHAETVAILRGVGLAAFKNGEEVRGLPSPPPQYTMLAKGLANQGKDTLLLGSVDDFTTPEAQETMRTAIADLTTEELKLVAGEDEILKPLIEALDMKDEDGNSILSADRQEMLRQLIANVAVGEMSMIDPMIADSLRAGGKDASPAARKKILDKAKAEAAKEKAPSGFLGAGLPDPAEMLAKARKGEDPLSGSTPSGGSGGSDDTVDKAVTAIMQHKVDSLSKYLKVPEDSVAATIAQSALQKGSWMETSKARIEPSPTPPVGSDTGKKASTLSFAYTFHPWPSF